MADPTDTPDSAAQEDAATPAPAPAGMGRDPRRILWLLALAALAVVVVLGVMLFRTVSTERTLRAVTSSVSLPAATGPAPTVAAVPPAPPVPASTVAAVQPAPPVPAQPTAPQVADAAPPSVTPAVPPTVAAAPNAEAPKAMRKVKSKKAQQAAKRRSAAAARGTFARCPALGKPGAVMCRWHICNGGAGKEAACRPYLERRP